MQLYRRFIIIFCFLSVLMMSGCSSAIWDRHPPPQPTTKNGLVVGVASGAAIGGIAAGGVGAGVGAVMGGIVGASFGNIIESHMTLVKQLQYNGVEVIQLGDEVKLILPSGRFFKPYSPAMNPLYYPVMNKVGEFIKQFQKVTVRIVAYTDDHGSWQRNLSLSRRQAQRVMQYLWNYGIDARLIYARGEGGKHPIANNNTQEGRRLNRRIEISLRRIRNFNQN